MNVIVSPKFQKDLDIINDENLEDNVIVLIEFLYSINTLSEISNLKKMKGFKNAFRIRLGDYRVGFLFENNAIQLSRIAHRKNIYDIFP
jgi:mRNA interferase RelE/StbE